MIISRVAELRRLDELLIALTRGEGGALIVHGDAGIGKTTRDEHALTSQELRVAAAVQRGASNRDIAADLFLSPKTVEFRRGSCSSSTSHSRPATRTSTGGSPPPHSR